MDRDTGERRRLARRRHDALLERGLRVEGEILPGEGGIGFFGPSFGADDWVSQLRQARDDQGRIYAKRQVIDEIAQGIPEQFLANPYVVKTILEQARGRGGPGSADAPIYTESEGGRPAAANRAHKLTELDHVAMDRLGKSEKEWRDMVNAYNPGEDGSVVLE